MHPFARTTREAPASAPKHTAEGKMPQDDRRWFRRLARLLGPKARDIKSRDLNGDPLLEFPAESIALPERAPKALATAERPATAVWWRPARAMSIAAALALVVAVAALQIRHLPVLGVTAQELQAGNLTIETRPGSLQVLLDGTLRGTTPLTLAVSPGDHSLTIRNGNDERVVPLTMAAGADVTKYFEMPVAPAMPVTGRLSVVTDPPGARVFVDGRPHGTSPVTIADLPEAQHRVTVASAGGSFERLVAVAAGSTASVVFSLLKTSGPVGGWLAVSAPFAVEIMEGADMIGTTGATRIMLAAGRHTIVLNNRSVGYEESRTVEIAAGRTTSIGVAPPNVQVSLNARPWAEITLDGTSVGQTPIANMLVPLGSHEVIFRHPQFAEVRQTVVVTANGPNRIAVDLTK
jgi:hypothetical protein